MADLLALAAQLRATRQAEQTQRAQRVQGAGAAASPGGAVGQGGMFQTGGYSPQQQPTQQDQQNPLQTGVDAYNKYKDFSKLMAPTQTFTGASPAAMSAMSSGGGSSLGTMGLMNTAPAVSFPGAATAASSGGTGAAAGAAGTGGATGALSTAGPIGAFLAGSKILNDRGISSYGDTFKGKAPAKLIDHAFGDDFGKSALGAFGKSMGSFFMGDMGGFAKNGAQAAKSFFTLDWL